MVEWAGRTDTPEHYSFVNIGSTDRRMGTVQSDRSGEIFQVLADRIIHEHDTYWTRNNVMLAISTAMLAISFTSGVALPAKTIFNSLGVVVAVVWVGMNVLSLRWIQFWEDQLQHFERTLPEPHIFGRYDERSTRGRMFSGLIEKLFMFISLLFVVAWIVFIIFGELC